MAGLDLVVGSGPSGVAAASALLDAGREVLMLDAGGSLEPERAALVSRLASRTPDRWTGEQLARAYEPLDAGWAPKRAFGSSYPYSPAGRSGLDQRGTRCVVSEARGGLSSVWGAAVLPFPEDELGDWPLSPSDLRPHYAKAATLMGLSGVVDGLAASFPFHAPPLPPLPLSSQGQGALARLDASSDPLAAAGFSWGRARHAASASRCREAALCLSGCPYGAIWSAADALPLLASRAGFRYAGGVRALRVERVASGVRVHAARAGESRTVFDGARAFLACGPLATARLVLGSASTPPPELALLAQPYFLLPLLLSGAPRALEPRMHTLAQVFVELLDREVSPRRVHLQLYGHNEPIARVAARLPGFVARRLEPRLAAIQGYLHSDMGAPIRLSSRGAGEDCRLTLEAGPRARAKEATRRVVAKLSRHARELGLRPLRPLLRHGLPGEGNHAGGVFPMRRAPGPWETDRLGRLAGEGVVHLVDSSVLPSLPATTFTYAVMANASRIATEASR